MDHLHESAITIISEGTHLEGKITFDRVARVHGILVGEVHATDGSTLILSETAVVDGNIEADIVLVDGYVQGDIRAKTRVVVSRSGRVVGNIYTSSLSLEFGAHFEGRSMMDAAAQAT